MYQILVMEFCHLECLHLKIKMDNWTCFQDQEVKVQCQIFHHSIDSHFLTIITDRWVRSPVQFLWYHHLLLSEVRLKVIPWILIPSQEVHGIWCPHGNRMQQEIKTLETMDTIQLLHKAQLTAREHPTHKDDGEDDK